MTDTPDDLLLLEAEHLARDLLLTADDKPQTLPGLITGWEHPIPAAAEITNIQTPNPLSQVREISRAIRQDAHDWMGPSKPDPKTRQDATAPRGRHYCASTTRSRGQSVCRDLARLLPGHSRCHQQPSSACGGTRRRYQEQTTRSACQDAGQLARLKITPDRTQAS
jgi:hypothetical protein